MHDIHLQYKRTEQDRLQDFIMELKEEKQGHVATVIHEWRLACLSLDLPGNHTVVGTGGDYPYRQAWDQQKYNAGPAIRWLGDEFIPILLREPVDNSPNKAVIFTPLLGQAWFVYWFLKTFHTGLSPFMFHTDNSSKRGEEMIEEFTKMESPAALILTPALGGTG